MAKKETIIIELDLDTSDLLKEGAKTSKTIKELTDAQKELKKAGQEGSIQYQKNAVALRDNKKELRENNKAIDQLNIANKAAAGSNEQLRAQLSVLTKQYNGLSDSERENTEEGKALNAQVNQITSTLKTNEEAVGDNRRSVGDYAKQLETTPFGTFISGIKSTGKAFLANPIGLIIAGIVGAIALLTKAFSRNEENSKKTGRAMAVLSGVFNKLLAVIEPVAVFIVDKLIGAFESLGEIADSTIGLVSDALSAIGFDSAAKSVDNFGSSLKGASKDAQALSDAQFELTKAEREVEIIRLTSLKNAEKQRQVRDDESKSIEERIAANENLGKVLEEQSEKELSIANESLRIADERIRLEGASTALLDARKDALVGVAEIEERITGQQSEQLVNVNSLLRDQVAKRKEAADAAKAAIEKEIALQQTQLDIFIAQGGIKKKSIEDELKLAEEVSKREVEILDAQLQNKLISQEEYNLAVLESQNELLLAQAEGITENAQIELDAIIEANANKLDQNQFLTDELLVQEQEKNANILAAQLDFEALRLEQGLVSQEEYDANIRAVKEEGAAIDQELLLEKAEADKEQRLVDIENQREIDILNRDSEFEIRQADLDRQKAQELANAESTGADTALINSKFAKIEKEIDKEKFQAKVSIASDTFGNLAEIAGKESAAGKAFAIAQTTIDTFAGAQSAFNSLAVIPIVGTALGAIAAGAAIASGIQRVNKIKNTQAPKVAKGGIFGGKPHSQGGTRGYFDDGTEIEVEKGELFAVVNKQNSGMISNLNDLNTYGGNGESFYARGGTKSFLRDGGIGINNAGGSVESDSNSASGITEAIESMPQPVVVVQDINEVQGETVSVEQRAIIS